jgi:DUF2911 family protein
MSRRSWIPAALAVVALAAPSYADLKLPRISPDAKVTQTVGLTDLTVTYSRPGVKGRTVWGDLVPYDKEWRTGANNATTFACSDTISFGGKTLPPGKYGLATVPGKDEWTVIINSQSDVWGTVYDPTKDILRVQVKPKPAPYQEWLWIGFDDIAPVAKDNINLVANQVNLVIHWENLHVEVPIQVEVTNRTLAACRAAIAEAKADDWRTLFNAARYTFQNEVGLDEGRAWLDKSLGIQKAYSNLTLLARWQMKDGKKNDAIATAKQAIAAGQASKEKTDTSEAEKLLADWTGKPAGKKS